MPNGESYVVVEDEGGLGEDGRAILRHFEEYAADSEVERRFRGGDGSDERIRIAFVFDPYPGLDRDVRLSMGFIETTPDRSVVYKIVDETVELTDIVRDTRHDRGLALSTFAIDDDRVEAHGVDR
ncbi:MAG: hypothetical protein ABEL76_03185 [Bradymonadaceae bacterium]